MLYPLREKKEILSKWFSFGPSRCLPDGREIFKIIHKNGFFMLYHLREKIFFEKPYIFRVPVTYPLREEKFLRMTPQTASLSGNK